MALDGTAFPRALDAPIDVTLSDDFDPEHLNTIDARVRAVEAKVGADASPVPASLDYRTRHLAIAASTTTTEGDFVTLWSLTMLDGTAVTLTPDVVAVRDGANEALGAGRTATYRCKAGVATIVGRELIRHEQRTLMPLAEVVIDTDGARVVRLRVKAGDTMRVHWTVRGEAIVAQPGGM
jgi:hypothetical protein